MVNAVNEQIFEILVFKIELITDTEKGVILPVVKSLTLSTW